MKILNVNMSIDPVMSGGQGERTVQLSRFLSRAGMQCTILTTSLGLNEEYLETLNGTRVVALPCLFERFYIPRFAVRDIRGLIENNDIVHLMGHWTLLNSLVFSVAARLQKPYVVCPAGALPIYGRSKHLKAMYNRAIGRRIIRNADGHVAITEDEIPQFQQYGVDRERVVVIPNGIDQGEYLACDDEGFRRKHGLGQSPFILFMGRLNPIKGPDLLLEAFCQLKNLLPDYHLVFAGPDGGMLPKLREVVSVHRMETRVHFTGYLGGADKSHAYHAADILAIPSRQEAMSIVVLESGICGTPVLLTDRCGFHEIEKIPGGFLVSASVEGIEIGLKRMAENPAALKNLGENLKAHVMAHFLWDHAVKKYLNLYSRILHSGS
jgi:glycosyltransferase involved in cell wall biosynthesis